MKPRFSQQSRGFALKRQWASSVASRNEKQGDAEAAPNQCDRAQKEDCRIQLTAALQFHGVTIACPPEPSAEARRRGLSAPPVPTMQNDVGASIDTLGKFPKKDLKGTPSRTAG